MAKFMKAVVNPEVDTEYVMIVDGRFDIPHTAVYMGEHENRPVWKTHDEHGEQITWQPRMVNGQWVNFDDRPVRVYNKLDFSLSGH